MELGENIYLRENSIYTIVDGPGWTWKEAQSEATSIGGNLVTINDESENQFLVDNFGFQNSIILDDFSVSDPSETYAGHWIGFSDQEEEGSWEWVNGESVTYTGWGSGQPDNNYSNSGGQDYAVILYQDQHEGYWDDLTNTDRAYRGIAETPFIRRGDSAYVVVEGPTWEEAEANANKLGGHLVTINNAEENNWLMSNIDADVGKTGFWTGLNDLNEEGVWEWTSGENVDYTNWMGPPNNHSGDDGGDEDAAFLITNGTYWNDGGDYSGKWNDGDNNDSRIENQLRGIAEIKLPSFAPSDRAELKTAIREWIFDEDSARETYGDINTWDVSGITDFSNLLSH